MILIFTYIPVSDFQDRTIYKDIHDNPVVAVFVDQPDHYLYSSARNYSGQKGLINVL